MSRRHLLGTASLLPLAALIPDALASSPADAATAYRFFTAHQAAVVDAATRRIAPGPTDDPAEVGHPGAHEANVVRYLDRMLSMFDEDPPLLFAGGPWSNRHTNGPDHMARFVPPDPVQMQAWRQRVAGVRRTYVAGVELLDRKAGGDFTSVTTVQQDHILASSDVADFTAVLFGHTIEGMYSVPEYGGNAGLVGWHEIKFPGDSQPRGYTAHELAEEQIDPIDPTGVTALLLEHFPTIARAMGTGSRRA